MYESKISDARWIAYDLPGNVMGVPATTASPSVLSAPTVKGPVSAR